MNYKLSEHIDSILILIRNICLILFCSVLSLKFGLDNLLFFCKILFVVCLYCIIFRCVVIFSEYLHGEYEE